MIKINKRDFVRQFSKYLKETGVFCLTIKDKDFVIVRIEPVLSDKPRKKMILSDKVDVDLSDKSKNVDTIENDVTTLQHSGLSKKRFKATIKVDEQIKTNEPPFTKEDVIEVLHKVDRIPKTYNSERYGCGCAKSEKYLCGKHGRI